MPSTTDFHATEAEVNNNSNNECTSPAAVSADGPQPSSCIANSSKTSADLAKTEEEQQPFRLLDLPDELWIKIGNMVIDDIQPKNVGIIWMCKSAAWANPDDYQPEGPEEHPGYEHFSFDLTPPAILQTCVSLRKELRNSYYHDKISITVRMCWWGMDESYLLLGQYLRMMGPEARRQIKAVSDEGWHKKTNPVPAPRWERFQSWEVEMMLVPVVRENWEADPGCDEIWYEITFL
ncbi:unnamed protein product [Zymoseptoria tritici ST99CH_1A5]|uniref:F-box domain-containing protein n=1 Tax=Zymoseptoria tritici ST99CH_1A5 TaxID=1276529 RepID=A0A1Y6LKV9_ZYMTR|nr:unnamed protein product [Zymoseptoria tritici ST99CH_1A5]